MVRYFSLFFLMILCVTSISSDAVFASDLLDRAFQPSRDMQQVINIGLNKNAVGNEVFRGSTSSDGSLGITNACYKPIPATDEADCKVKKWNREKEPKKCYAVPGIDGATKDTCTDLGGDWTMITFVSLTKNPPLLVRITKTLLRLTIGISITMLMYIGVQTIIAWMSGWSITDKMKELANVIIGLLLALSAVGIVFLIQSIAMHSLAGIGTII